MTACWPNQELKHGAVLCWQLEIGRCDQSWDPQGFGAVLNSIQTHHRMIEWLSLEGTPNIILFQPPAMGRDIFH